MHIERIRKADNMSAIHPTLLWKTNDSISVAEDSTWSASVWYTYSSGSEFKITAGNKTYALSNEPIFSGPFDDDASSSSSAASLKRSRFVSEAAVLRKYR